MKVYSENLFHFAAKLERQLKTIISKECRLEVRRSRFVFDRYTYPIHIVFFESKNQIGYFDPHTYQIGVNSELIYNCKENVLSDILRHEFAHYLQFLKSKHPVLPHGDEFKAICHHFGWDKAISKASMDIELENEKSVGNLACEKMMEKVKRLLNLAHSDNVHEAELATVKANELILKYNLKHFQAHDETKFYTCELIKAKRKNAKLSCIYEILKHFMVKPILIYGKGQVAIEACGHKEAIELAQYVCQFLDSELDNLWNNQDVFKGMREKNSFYHGIAKGYEQKMQQVHAQFSSDQCHSLTVINEHISQGFNQIYKKTSHTYSQAKTHGSAFSKGIDAGKNLNIQSVLKNKNNKSIAKLTWESK